MIWHDGKKTVVTKQKFPKLDMVVEFYQQRGGFWMNIKKKDQEYNISLGNKMAIANEKYLQKVIEVTKEVDKNEGI